MRLVIDSNVLISHLLLPGSTPAKAVRHAFRHHTVLSSGALLLELNVTLGRSKFDRYISHDDRNQFLHKLHKNCQPVEIIQRINACRDEDNNRILELAVNGKADRILSGDRDLLTLSPFRNIPIVTPAEFLRSM